jgi:hypothetical protein
MEIPSESVIDRPIVLPSTNSPRKIVLQRRREIIGIAMPTVSKRSYVSSISSLPEVKVLRHIHLLEYVHKSLFFCGFLDFVVERNWNDISTLTMVEIMTTKESNNRAFRYNDHVPSGSKANKPWCSG